MKRSTSVLSLIMLVSALFLAGASSAMIIRHNVNSLPLKRVNGPGDSGGPALVGADSGLQIIGVSSGGRYENDLEHEVSRQGQYGWQEFLSSDLTDAHLD